MSGTSEAVEAAGRQLVWQADQLCWTVRMGEHVWRSEAPAEDALVCRAGSRQAALSPARARRVESGPFRNGAFAGFACRLSRFDDLPAGADVRLALVVALEAATGDLVVWIDGHTEGLSLAWLHWPGAVVTDGGPWEETILPSGQGALLPGTWPQEVTHQWRTCNSRDMYMPWWAQKRGRPGYMAIIETDADAGCRLVHPAGGPSRIAPRWDESLGGFGGQRRLRYRFFERCDYVSACKSYRDHVIRQARFVRLTEKALITPRVKRLAGTPVIHAGIAHTIHPLSRYYNAQEPDKNHVCVPFATRERQLRALHAVGVPRAYVHLDGWGVEGYDSHHPDYLPINEEAGGREGLRALAEACHEIGCLFALHDQYRDYYHNAATFDERYAIHDADGGVPEEHIWYGGPQSILCARLAPGYVLSNHRELRRQGIRVDGSYLDVFSVVPPDQCHHPEHRLTRAECLQARAECFAVIRQLEGVVSSEEPVDYAVPHLHLVHHAPYPREQWMFGGPERVPGVPLLNLVYHDAILTPWACAPGEEEALAALNGGMPYLEIVPGEHELERVARLCALHQRVAMQEMVSHEFLDERGTRQRSVFADGTVVTVNIATGHWDTR